MTKEEYQNTAKEMLAAFNSAISDLAKQYVKDNIEVLEPGTTIRDEVGLAVVKHAKIRMLPIGSIPIVVYICDNVTSEGKVSKRNPIREITSETPYKKVNKRK